LTVGRGLPPGAALLALALSGAGCQFGGRAPEADAPRAIPLARAQRGTFREVVEEVGVIRARATTDVKAPFHGRVLRLVPEGTTVAEGDPILTMDTSELERRLEREQADFRAAESELEKQLERIASQERSITLARAQTAANLRFEEAKLASARAAEQDAARRAEAGLVPTSTRDRARQALREAELEHERARLKREQQDEDVRLKQRQLETDRRQADRRFARARERLAQVQRDVERGVVRAPTAGQVFYPVRWFQGSSDERKLRPGDQVSPWDDRILQIPDRSTMEVRSQVDETLMSRVVTGTRAEVRLTALEGLVTGASVSGLGPVAIRRSRSEAAGFSDQQEAAGEQVVIPVTLQLDALDDRLQQGMTASVTYVLRVIEDAVSLPVDAVLGGADAPRVYVKTASGIDERGVELGPTSGGRVVVTAGLRGGEEVYLGDPRTEPAS
jgi:multidrug resistance efflux pump